MVNGHRGGERRLDVIGLFGNFLEISGPGHADGKNHLVNQKTNAYQVKSEIGGKHEFGKPIPEADENQDHRFGGQHKPFPHFIYGPAE